MPDTRLNPNEINQLLESRPVRRTGFAIAGLICLMIIALFLIARPEAKNHHQYKTLAVERRNLVATVSATGNLKPVDQVDVGSEISGIITKVLVDTNDRVAKNTILAVIDTTKLEQQVQKSHAAVLSAEAALVKAKTTQQEANADLVRFEKVHRLSNGRVPSRSELDAARAAKLRADAAVKVSMADLAESKAGLLANQIDLKKSVIRSPINGVVLNRWIEPGQTVAASFQAPVLFTIGQDLRQMVLTVYVSEADVGRVKKGQTALFTVDAWPESEFEAVVKKVSFGSQTIENVVSYETELEVSNPEMMLRPGMTATAAIRVAERQDVLAVANPALRFRPPSRDKKARKFSIFPSSPKPVRSEPGGNEDAVYVMGEDGLARITVNVGLSDGQWTEVSSPDLNRGDKVAVDILEKN